jgi:hypothetical protein
VARSSSRLAGDERCTSWANTASRFAAPAGVSREYLEAASQLARMSSLWYPEPLTGLDSCRAQCVDLHDLGNYSARIGARIRRRGDRPQRLAGLHHNPGHASMARARNAVIGSLRAASKHQPAKHQRERCRADSERASQPAAAPSQPQRSGPQCRGLSSGRPAQRGARLAGNRPGWRRACLQQHALRELLGCLAALPHAELSCRTPRDSELA